MKVTKYVLNIINDVITDRPIETGEILGSHNDVLINEIIMDLPDPTNTSHCSYLPNVAFLNQNIDEWQKSGIYNP